MSGSRPSCRAPVDKAAPSAELQGLPQQRPSRAGHAPAVELTRTGTATFGLSPPRLLPVVQAGGTPAVQLGLSTPAQGAAAGRLAPGVALHDLLVRQQGHPAPAFEVRAPAPELLCPLVVLYQDALLASSLSCSACAFASSSSAAAAAPSPGAPPPPPAPCPARFVATPVGSGVEASPADVPSPEAAFEFWLAARFGRASSRSKACSAVW
eukprot:CAMPEP_0204570680 /NCGR_PEP_ID=MMETSP0661-20131031/38454_1 /ASSEMBLY_ACC=CAM_ASM_000606 /TAXON_ID=109239 /ORGANISM="Alexandrium margalefi, Strain AMGDE01CS-322" /LENGTH=209 /DNA_ID=CAMNT_0051578875 /DNA_START=158 /DNA_END=785 /DNA_ORIENTATION=-